MISPLSSAITDADLASSFISDLDLEAAEEDAIEQLAKHCHTPFDYCLAVSVGIAAVDTARALSCCTPEE